MSKNKQGKVDARLDELERLAKATEGCETVLSKRIAELTRNDSWLADRCKDIADRLAKLESGKAEVQDGGDLLVRSMAEVWADVWPKLVKALEPYTRHSGNLTLGLVDCVRGVAGEWSEIRGTVEAYAKNNRVEKLPTVEVVRNLLHAYLGLKLDREAVLSALGASYDDFKSLYDNVYDLRIAARQAHIERDEARAMLAKSESDATIFSLEAGGARGEVRRLRAALESQREGIGKYHARVAKLEDELRAAKDAAGETDETIRRLRAALDSSSAALDSANKAIEERATERDEAYTRLRAMEGLGAMFERSQSALVKVKAERDTGYAENENLRGEIIGLRKRVDVLEIALAERTDELGTAQRLIAEADDLDDADMVAQGDPVKGAEAEELRKGVEDLIKAADSNDGVVSWHALQSLLDRVNARDSNAFLAHSERAETGKPVACHRCNASDSERLYFWTCRECLGEPKAIDKAAALREAGWEERVSGWSPDGGYSAWTLDGAYDAMVAARKAAPARLDPDGTAKPLTRIVTHPKAGDCVGPGTPLANPEYEAADGTRTPLTMPRDEVAALREAGWVSLGDGKWSERAFTNTKPMTLADAYAVVVANRTETTDLEANGWTWDKLYGWTDGDRRIWSTDDAHAVMLADCAKTPPRDPLANPDPGEQLANAKIENEKLRSQANMLRAELREAGFALNEAGWNCRDDVWWNPDGIDGYDISAAYAEMLAEREKNVTRDSAAEAHAADKAAELRASGWVHSQEKGWAFGPHAPGYHTTEQAYAVVMAGRALAADLVAVSTPPKSAEALPRDTMTQPEPGDLYVEISDEGANIDDADIWMAGTIRGLSPADVIKDGPGWIRPATPEEAAKIRRDNGLDSNALRGGQ